jgi:hypothetical protein
MLHKLSMTKPIDRTSEIAVKKLADKIIFSQKYSRNDHSILTALIGNSNVSEGGRRQLNRILNHIQDGELQLMDW